MATTKQTNNTNQALYDTIDKMCSAVFWGQGLTFD